MNKFRNSVVMDHVTEFTFAPRSLLYPSSYQICRLSKIVVK